MKNKTDYVKLSDFQISKEICERELGLSLDKDIRKMFMEGKFDYCNDWAVMGPLIQQNKIVVDGYGRAWTIANGDTYSQFTKCEGKPLRAAAIVYLMLSDRANNLKTPLV